MPFLIRLLVNAAALWVATQIVGGVTYRGGALPLFAVALIFGIVNAVLRPIAFILTFPILIVTLGLFTFVINGVMLMLTSGVSGALGLGFHVAGFWAAFWGALVVTTVSWLLSILIKDAARADD
jgi:putative membrane protein